ncbi:MAG: helix-turn-helix domain-containing protein [Clostridiales bacterium]|nr:helix-turn-helix domain-containing protein [Clostridiales bacterium]
MFAQKIRELRLSRNLSEAALDEIFGLMRGTVANWEHGFAYPDDELIDDIAEYFKIKRSELIGAA